MLDITYNGFDVGSTMTKETRNAIENLIKKNEHLELALKGLREGRDARRKKALWYSKQLTETEAKKQHVMKQANKCFYKLNLVKDAFTPLLPEGVTASEYLRKYIREM